MLGNIITKILIIVQLSTIGIIFLEIFKNEKWHLRKNRGSVETILSF